MPDVRSRIDSIVVFHRLVFYWAALFKGRPFNLKYLEINIVYFKLSCIFELSLKQSQSQSKLNKMSKFKHPLQIVKTGYGHWKITTTYYGKQISTTTTDSMAIDDYNSEDDEKDGRELRRLRGYNALRSQIIRNNKR